MDYHNMSAEETIRSLSATTTGLSGKECAARLEKYGKNALREAKKRSFPERVWEQIKDPMVLVLIGAAIVSGLIGEIADMVIILIVVVINAIIGLIQENKAEQAVEALKKMSAQTAKVLRDGKTVHIDSEELVPGDVVLLDAGDIVPADLRLFESSSLKIEEASLTGESVPSEKDARVTIDKDAPLGDRVNMAYYGTGVTYGRAKGVVCETGMKTEMGKIASMLDTTESDETPLQRKLAEIGKILTVLVMVICVVIFAAIMFKSGEMSFEMAMHAFMIAVSLAVAAIPEGLPAVVTIVMSIGVTKMAKRNAIIKKLPAVETLGCAEVICSDKTGTLTQNKMNIRELYTDDSRYTADNFFYESKNVMLTDIIHLCNDSEINENGGEIGDPTETCLKRFVLGNYKRERFEPFRRIADLPFDSDRKMMSVVYETPSGDYVYTKGAPDEVLKKCVKMSVNGNTRDLTDADRDKIIGANSEMARKALRVLAAAFKAYDKNDKGEIEENLIFCGLVGMIDPPRPEAYDAIRLCKRAGITTVMITGDHKDTAVAIATELGIIEDESQAVFGSVLDTMSDEELSEAVKTIRVYARVSPAHKVRIVEAWKRSGKIVAMTGDGVNDAPALKIADIGVGMGITGTDVSKGVSDILLADDNFATIVNAVEEGRKIYTNIRKSIHFLLSSNISEVVTMFTATLLLPSGVEFLGAVHILWINLVTDTLPAIGLGMNKGEDGVMNLPPRNANAGIFSGGMGAKILYQGVLLSIITLLSYYFGNFSSHAVATTMAFVTLSSVQLFHSFNIKAGRGTSISRETFDNPMMIIGFIVPFALMFLIMYIPFMANMFDIVPLGLREWGIATGLAFTVIPIDELVRLVLRKIKKK